MQTLDKDQYTFIKLMNLCELINSSFIFESHAKPFAFVMKMQQSRYLKLVELENNTYSIKWLNRHIWCWMSRRNDLIKMFGFGWFSWSQNISSSKWKYDAEREKSTTPKLYAKQRAKRSWVGWWFSVCAVRSLAYSFWTMNYVCQVIFIFIQFIEYHLTCQHWNVILDNHENQINWWSTFKNSGAVNFSNLYI